jgi:putative DNA primase/helicase
MIISNELPALADASGALASRLIIAPLQKSFLGRENVHLHDDLIKELPGILNWSIEGWKRLRERNRFVQPESGQALVQQMEDLASPVRNFLRECCEQGTGKQVKVADLFDSWRLWCSRAGRRHVGDVQSFGRDLRAAAPAIGHPKQRRDGEAGSSGDNRTRVYEGVALIDAARRALEKHRKEEQEKRDREAQPLPK